MIISCPYKDRLRRLIKWYTVIRKLRKLDSTKVPQSGYNSNNIFEIKKREPNRKMETFLSLMAFLLIQQTVGENIGSEEDPYIEGGKTIIVKWKLVIIFENTNVSYQKALKGIILGGKYVYLKDFLVCLCSWIDNM